MQDYAGKTQSWNHAGIYDTNQLLEEYTILTRRANKNHLTQEKENAEYKYTKFYHWRDTVSFLL